MKAIDSFRKIYDTATVHERLRQCDIVEEDLQATFTKLSLVNEGEHFYLIDKDVYKKGNICTKASNQLENKDCDGVVFTRLENKNYCLLAELKSNFDTSKIREAYKQITFTLLKIHTMFSLCDGYELDDIDIVGIISCKPPKSSEKLDLLQSQETNKPDVRFAVKLYNDCNVTTTVGKIPFIANLPIIKKLGEKQIKINLTMPKNTNDSEYSVNLSAIV